MLILNTNNQGGGGYTLSNDSLRLYPDFKNSILVIPPSSIEMTTWATYPVVYSVNGTGINYRGWTLVAPDYYTSETETWLITIWWWSGSDVNWTGMFRVWIPYEFFGGEIIWKKITAWFCWLFSHWVNSNSDTSTELIKLDYIVKLLHLDWTLTTIWTVSMPWYSMSYQGLDYWNYKSPVCQYSISTSWVSAQAWDIVVVDYDVQYKWTWWSIYNYARIILWYKMTSVDEHRIPPVEISID